MKSPFLKSMFPQAVGLRPSAPFAAFLASIAFLMNPVMADGGGGGNGGAGGADNPIGAGGDGTDSFNGAGGGGAGVTGGDGGDSLAAGVGGTGGAAPGASGADGGDNPAGGGGGGGGAHGFSGVALPGGVVTGGAGGEGGDATSFGAGGGGAGGWGVVVGGIGNLGILGTNVTGGDGGDGGSGAASTAGGAGGTGGIGLASIGANGTIVINAAVVGGAGGTGGAGTIVGADGVGGAGITGSNLTLTMGAAGTVSGGLAGDGVTRADAITFTGGNNSLTFTNATTGLTGNIGNNGTLLTFNQPTAVTVDNMITGTGGVTLTGSTPLGDNFTRLNGANTYAGLTTVNGYLIAGNDSALGSTASGTVVNSGGTLGINGGVNVGAEALTISGAGFDAGFGGPSGAVYFGTFGGGNSSYGGAITLSGDATLGGLGTGTMTGGINTGGNTLTFGNGYSSTTFNVNSTGISGSGNVVLNGTTSPTVNFNANNSYTGTTTVNGGTLNLNGSTNTNSGVTGAVLNIGDGVGAANSAVVRNTTAGQINNVAAVTVNSDGLFDLNGGSESIGSLAGGGNVTLGGATLTTGGNNTDTTFSGVISEAGGITKVGTGTFLITGANTYTGVTNVNSGILSINSATGLGAGGAGNGTVVASGATLLINTGINVTNESLSIAGSGAPGMGGALRNESGTNTWGGAITLTNNASIIAMAGSTLNLNGGIDKTDFTLTSTAQGGATINYGAAITGDNDNLFNDDMTFTGGGTHNLNAANTYQGKTNITVSGTTVNANVANAIPTANGRSEVTMQAGTTLNTNAQQFIATLSGAGTVNNGGNLFTMGYGGGPGGNPTADFSGSINGTGGLDKDGTNNQTLSGTNNYTGFTAVLGGTLTIGGTGSIANSNGVNVNGGAALVLSAGNSNQLGNGIQLTLDANTTPGGSTLTLGGSETIGTLTDNGGSLINGNGTLTAGLINLNATTTNFGANLVSTGNINSVGFNTVLNGNTNSNNFNVNGGNVIANGTTTTNTLNVANNTNFSASNGVLNAGTINLNGLTSGLFLSANTANYSYNLLQGIGFINPVGLGGGLPAGGATFTNEAGANLAPGFLLAVGQIAMGGNYVESGNLWIDYNPNFGFGNPAAADNLLVLGGGATITGSSVLRLNDLTGGGVTVGIGQRYNIIDTGTAGLPGGPVIAGGFGEITDGNNPGPNGVTDPNQFFFDRGTGNLVGTGLINNQGPGAYGCTANSTAILIGLTTAATDAAGNYNSADGGSGTALDLVYGGPAPGGPITAAQLCANLNALSPESYAGALDYTLHATRNYTRTATSGSGPADGGSAVHRMQTSYGATASGAGAAAMGVDVFAGFSYMNVEADSSSPLHNYELQSTGGYAGVRLANMGNCQLGAFLAIDDGSVDSGALNLDAEGVVFGAFGRMDWGPCFAWLSGSYGSYEFDGTRAALGGVVTAAGFTSDVFEFGIGTGYTVVDTGDFRMTPKISLDYLNADVDRIAEFGGPGALLVGPQSAEMLLLELGVEFVYAPQMQPWGIAGELGWQHDFKDASRPVSAAFGGGGGAPFTVIAPGLGEDAFYFTLRGHYDISDQWRLGVGYRGELRDDSDILNAVDARVTVSF